jgi:ribosomal protein L11 methyltransferase
VTGWKAWLDVTPQARPARELQLEPLAEDGFVVTSRELSRDGPWRLEVFGAGDRSKVEAAIDAAWRWETLPDIDWVAENQRSFRPFVVGPFWVHPSHAGEAVPQDSIPLEIDAGLAFGTGTHATTRGCLEILAMLDARQTAKAIDVGCGSGILAIAMAKLWRRPVLGSDSDAQAVAVARENARLNGVDDLCGFVHASGLGAPASMSRASYDLIVANILAGPLLDLADSFSAAVRPGGRLLLSGILVEQAAHIVAVYARRGFAHERHVDLESGGASWRTLLLRRTEAEVS